MNYGIKKSSQGPMNSTRLFSMSFANMVFYDTDELIEEVKRTQALT